MLVTHENPDGDALGSILALKLALDQLGKDSVMYLYGDAPLPAEYSFMPLAELRRRLPDDWRDRVLIAVDCANESRIGPAEEPLVGSPLVLDIEHAFRPDQSDRSERLVDWRGPARRLRGAWC